MKNTEEYLMLREEILHLDTLVNNTLNMLYAFVAAVLSFALTQIDSIYTLIPYVVIVPVYFIVLSKMKGIYKIAAYLYIFHEGENFNWERRQEELYSLSALKTFDKKIQSFNLPFLFTSSFVTIVFFIKTRWAYICATEEVIKLILAVTLYLLQLILIIKNRRIGIHNYLPFWEMVKKS